MFTVMKDYDFARQSELQGLFLVSTLIEESEAYLRMDEWRKALMNIEWGQKLEALASGRKPLAVAFIH